MRPENACEEFGEPGAAIAVEASHHEPEWVCRLAVVRRRRELAF
jgi:hypothetical protein